MLRPAPLLTCFSLLLPGALGVAESADRVRVIRPEAAPGPLANPLKGWCPFVDANPITQPYSMVYLDASWRELEPTSGHFDFDGWERRAWNRPAGRNKHIVFRIIIDHPGRPSGLPDWLKGQVKQTPYQEHGGGLSPDYDNPLLVAGLERLIAALGERYDRDPRVAFIEVGLLGYWGEWHTWPNDRLKPSVATERRVIDAYHKAFPTVGLMARSARDYAGRQDWLGFHDDLFPEDTDNGQDWSFLASIRRSGRAENWRRAPIGGEMVPGAAQKWVGDPQTRTLIERGHFSWVGPYCPAMARLGSWSDAEGLVRRMGYQFRWDELRLPTQVRAGQPCQVELRGQNEGVAPFYRPWDVQLALIPPASGTGAAACAAAVAVGATRVAVDVRTWLPGPIELKAAPTFQVPPGAYQLALGIIDPMTGRPAVGFANKLDARQGWTLLGPVEVVTAR